MTNESQPIPPDPISNVQAPSAPPTAPGILGRRPKQPVWPNVIGVIGIIYAIMGILAVGMQVLSLFAFDWMSDFAPAGALDATTDVMDKHAPALTALAIASALVAIVLLVGSCGLTSHKPWSRPALLGWAVLKITMAIATAVHGYFMSRDMMAAQATQTGAPAPPPFVMDTAIAVSMVFNLVFYSAFAVFILIWLHLNGPRTLMQRWRSEPREPARGH